MTKKYKNFDADDENKKFVSVLDSEHNRFIKVIDNEVTKSYANFKKLVRENYVQKNIIYNRNIYNSLIKIKESTNKLLEMYIEKRIISWQT